MEQLEMKMPKNMRQIGEAGQARKVFIEDYVYTYLRQLAQGHLTSMKTAMLVGQANEQGFFVKGALELDMGQLMQGWFDNEHWRIAFDLIREWFEGLDIVGWYLSNPGFGTDMTDEIKAIHLRNFSGNQYMFLQMDILEREEKIYVWEEGQPISLEGYYIFYEKNEAMQAYISSQKGGAGIESEGIQKDEAALRFRNRMKEKKEQTTQKRTMTFLYASCTFLVLVILVIGVTIIGSYDRMLSMENTINQISENLGEQEQAKLQGAELNLAVQKENQSVKENQEDSSDNTAENEPEVMEETDNEEPVIEEPAEEEEENEENEEKEENEEEMQAVFSSSVKQPESYLIQKGDTLLGICRIHYGDDDMLPSVCELNGLENMDRIYAGETILLP